MTASNTGPIPTPNATTTSAAAHRAERDKQWAEKQLKKIGKGGALDDLAANWFSYTPFEMTLLLDPMETSAALEARIGRVARLFESTRNMLIVVPLMLTWLSLGLAGAAYEQSLSAPKPLTEPFLQQWQEGFPAIETISLWRWRIPIVVHSVHWFTFAGFALVDATLLAILFVLTVTGQVLDYWAYRRSTRLARFLDTYLYGLQHQALSMTKSPANALPPWLRELQSHLGRLGEVINKTNDALDTSLRSYTESIKSQEQAVNALLGDTKNLHTSVYELKELFQVGSKAALVYQQYIPKAEEHLNNLARDQRVSTEKLQAYTDMLTRSMIYLGDLAGQLQEAEAVVRQYQGILSDQPSPTVRPSGQWQRPRWSRPPASYRQQPQNPRYLGPMPADELVDEQAEPGLFEKLWGSIRRRR